MMSNVHPDTRRGVEQVLAVMRKLKAKIYHEKMCGPRLRVVHATTEGPVQLTVKFWMDTKTQAYTMVFNLEFTAEATETQVIDALKKAPFYLGNMPQFLPEETDDILTVLAEHLGPTQ